MGATMRMMGVAALLMLMTAAWPLSAAAEEAAAATQSPARTAAPAAEATATQPAAAEGGATEGAVAPVSSPPAAATVEAAAIAEVQAQVPVSGTLVARQEVQVYPQVSGFEIEAIMVEAGDRVEKGAPLARLSNQTLKAQLAQADAEYQRAEAGLSQARSQIASSDASLAQATAALERARKLQRSGSATQAALDQAVSAEAVARAAAGSAGDGVAVAQAQVAQAAASRDIARLNVERTQIVAPVAGVVSARNAELGAIAGSTGAPLFTLIGNGTIEVAGEVIEVALDGLNVGDTALMRVAGVGEVAGEVRLVPASVDPVTRLGIVRVALQPNPALRTGLFASGWITTEKRMAVTVPAGAVLSNNTAQGDIVQVVRDGRIESRAVKMGLLWQGRVEILSGLTEGEIVVARAAAFFRDGDSIDAVLTKAGGDRTTGAAAPQSAPAPITPAASAAPQTEAAR